MLRAALLYLVIGTILGLLMFLGYANPDFRWALRFRSTHVHLILVGSVIQTIMGVALWMFPRRKHPPYWTPEREGMALFVVFNLGVILRSLTEAWAWAHPVLYRAALSGMILEILGILYFAFLILQRIREPKPVV